MEGCPGGFQEYFDPKGSRAGSQYGLSRLKVPICNSSSTCISMSIFTPFGILSCFLMFSFVDDSPFSGSTELGLTWPEDLRLVEGNKKNATEAHRKVESYEVEASKAMAECLRKVLTKIESNLTAARSNLAETRANMSMARADLELEKQKRERSGVVEKLTRAKREVEATIKRYKASMDFVTDMAHVVATF